MIKLKHSIFFFTIMIIINILLIIIIVFFASLLKLDRNMAILYIICIELFFFISYQFTFFYIKIYNYIKNRDKTFIEIKKCSKELVNILKIQIKELEKNNNKQKDFFSIDTFEYMSKQKNYNKKKSAFDSVNINNIYKYHDHINKYNKINEKNEKIIINNNIKIYKITRREKEVIDLISKGMESKEIGHQLNISINTVNNHIKNIYKKCDVQNKIELINILKSPYKFRNYS